VLFWWGEENRPDDFDRQLKKNEHQKELEEEEEEMSLWLRDPIAWSRKYCHVDYPSKG